MLKSRKKIVIICITASMMMNSTINTFAIVNKSGVNVNEKQSIMYSESKNNTIKPQGEKKIDGKYKWNLEDIYKDVQAWEKDIEKVRKEYFPKYKEYEGKLKDPNKLLEFLKMDEEASIVLSKIYWYAGFRGDLNQGDNEATELISKADSLVAEYDQLVTFFTPELLSQDEASLKSLIANPKLKNYAHFIESLIRQKEHALSKEEEDILANASEFVGSPQEIFNKLRMADMRKAIIKDKNGKDIELTSGVYSNILDGKDRELRKKSFEANGKVTEELQNTFASIYLASVKKDIFLAKSRKYNSTLEASLAKDNIPREVYDNLITAVNNNMEPLHKYVELKRKITNLDKIHAYDLYVPLVDNYKLIIPYEDAKKMVLEGLKPLGEEYLSIVKKGFDNRWLDVYESKGKRTGGYNLGLYGVHPFILLNYTDSLDDMLTVGHEMGHAVNSVYAGKAQSYMNAHTPIFNAEVASTANELMIIKNMIKNAKNDDEKLYLLNQLIENIKGTVYTQVMFAEFEKTVHEKLEAGEPLSAKSLRQIYGDLIKKYYGDSFAPDELGTLGWAKITHFYNNFYVYKYATSMAASNEIVKNILDGKDKDAVNKYLEFLKTGSSEYPVDALKKAGVDPTKTTSIDNLLAEFGQYVDEMETILKKQGKIK
ncbi:oligoendopeptidase F [Clostridium argentinense CDC 2741]|uniref:Oligopeptidase F n=1 Tax=Clostridium argentinense CDC 2741 TaxID=1418104 RepID=A0A0C1UAC1_9CLOT|nr:oligoendopeptidase F [Clostridium argentinense]KIE44495.1 oligoendopeptidase F [Clostridium argentinense CDC 2741]NFF39704.1 oligoendopeptidase F [Clostridium argentinense]NFP49704.1 oligoendopeptidase F [Clostridium argentinense]NFP72105.1 oligoendopeptidase F [Clostridium argentinense]NFP76806.1 oligoendopeptidase F [Clostridium argentinense]